jgi:hypothetical protein
MLFGIKDAADLILKRKKDGKIVLSSDYFNVSTNASTANRTYAMKKGVKAIAWDGEKESTLTLSAEIYDLQWFGLLSGDEMLKGEQDIIQREVVKITSGKAILKKKPLSGTFNAFTLEPDKITHITELGVTASATPEAGKYIFDSADATGKTIKVNSTTCPDGSFIVAYYMIKSAPSTVRFAINAQKFSDAFEVHGKIFARPQDGTADQRISFVCPNARPKSDITITMDSSNVSQIEVTFDLFPDENNDLIVYNINTGE